MFFDKGEENIELMDDRSFKFYGIGNKHEKYLNKEWTINEKTKIQVFKQDREPIEVLTQQKKTVYQFKQNLAILLSKTADEIILTYNKNQYPKNEKTGLPQNEIQDFIHLEDEDKLGDEFPNHSEIQMVSKLTVKFLNQKIDEEDKNENVVKTNYVEVQDLPVYIVNSSTVNNFKNRIIYELNKRAESEEMIAESDEWKAIKAIKIDDLLLVYSIYDLKDEDMLNKYNIPTKNDQKLILQKVNPNRECKNECIDQGY